jgi:hypothetical protein
MEDDLIDNAIAFSRNDATINIIRAVAGGLFKVGTLF